MANLLSLSSGSVPFDESGLHGAQLVMRTTDIDVTLRISIRHAADLIHACGWSGTNTLRRWRSGGH